MQIIYQNIIEKLKYIIFLFGKKQISNFCSKVQQFCKKYKLRSLISSEKLAESEIDSKIDGKNWSVKQDYKILLSIRKRCIECNSFLFFYPQHRNLNLVEKELAIFQLLDSILAEITLNMHSIAFESPELLFISLKFSRVFAKRIAMKWIGQSGDFHDAVLMYRIA